MKRCSSCGEEKPSGDFYRNRRAPDGFQARCKTCQTAVNRAYRLAHPEYDRARHQRYREKHADQIRERHAVWSSANPEKRRAHHVVRRALRNGSLVRPSACSRCASTERSIEAHHEDYTQPLAVMWLCASCHRVRHMEAMA